MSAALSFDHLSMDYAGFKALDTLCLELKQGEVLGLLGHNGAGKTTSMKLAMGIIAPTSGRISVLGEDPTGPASDQLRRAIGYLPENVSFYPQLTGRETLRYFARLKGVDNSEVERLLEKVALTDAANKRIRTYSKGMRQRIGLAQALLGQPRLLLLDEPTAGLDPEVTREFYGMIDTLRHQGVTVLISSHVLPGVETHIDRAAILGHGKLLALGSLKALREEAQLPLTVRIHGAPDRQALLPGLEQAGYHLVREHPQGLDIQGHDSGKLTALRLLLEQPGVEDIEIMQPSLESLYTHYNRQALGTQP